MQKPSVGRVVHVLVDPAANNSSDIAPAVITRVWRDDYINARILHDGPVVGAPQANRQEWVTSIGLHEDEDAARATGLVHAAFWPPRV